MSTTLALLALLSRPVLASEPATPAITVTGDFCEVIWGRDKWQRVSCFSVASTDDGPVLKGTAFSWARERDDRIVAPVIAHWQLDEVISYDSARQVLVYTYRGTMNTGDAFEGTSSVGFDLSTGRATEGWYGTTTDGEQTRFRLRSLADLEACLGVTTPEQTASERYQRVALASSAQLTRCVADPGQ